MTKSVTLWRPISGWNGMYEISNKGQVRRHGFSNQGKTNIVYNFPQHSIKGHVDSDGTVSVKLSDGVNSRRCKVHTLLMAAFPSISEWDALELAEESNAPAKRAIAAKAK